MQLVIITCTVQDLVIQGDEYQRCHVVRVFLTKKKQQMAILPAFFHK